MDGDRLRSLTADGQAEGPLAAFEGPSGVIVEVRDESKPYAYSNLYHVRLRVTARFPDAEAAANRRVQVGPDGMKLAGEFPWPNCGVATLPNVSWQLLGQGCNPALAVAKENVTMKSTMSKLFDRLPVGTWACWDRPPAASSGR